MPDYAVLLVLMCVYEQKNTFYKSLDINNTLPTLISMGVETPTRHPHAATCNSLREIEICLFVKSPLIKTYSSEEIEDKVVEGERDNDDNHEYVYYFFMERAPARSRLWNGRWGWVVGRYMGCNSLFSIYCLIFFCRLHQEGWVTAYIFQEVWKLNNIQNGLLMVYIKEKI